jgi:hypothetical protein
MVLMSCIAWTCNLGPARQEGPPGCKDVHHCHHDDVEGPPGRKDVHHHHHDDVEGPKDICPPPPP